MGGPGQTGMKWVKRAFRVTMAWQFAASLAIAMVALPISGLHGMWSGLLGGAIGMAGLLTFALLTARRSASAGGAVRMALRAEAAKVAVIVLLLWLVFATYREMVVLAFIAAFILSILLSAMAFAIPDEQPNS
jgi:ATP synthase protein I